MSSLLADHGVDLGALGSWMDEQGLPGGAFDLAEALSGGTQNVLARIERGGRSYVLRRPPLHLRSRSNDNLLREARILAALDGQDVAAPALVGVCDDPSVLNGACFLLMETIDGFNAATGLPGPHASDPSLRREMGLNAARALARLGRVDHVAVGLTDFGQPDTFLERQVPRWLAELSSYDVAELPDVDELATWLTGNQPASFTPGILHGDYHLANLLFAPDSARVAGIVDWEMATIGDPLLDLGWLLATWPDDTPPGRLLGRNFGSLAALPGLPSRAELVAAYAADSDRDLTHVRWYAVLACFKLGIVLEGTYSRSRVGKAPREVGDALHATALALFARARSYLKENW